LSGVVSDVVVGARDAGTELYTRSNSDGDFAIAEGTWVAGSIGAEAEADVEDFEVADEDEVDVCWKVHTMEHVAEEVVALFHQRQNSDGDDAAS